jgi:hypothetical protein
MPPGPAGFDRPPAAVERVARRVGVAPGEPPAVRPFGWICAVLDRFIGRHAPALGDPGLACPPRGRARPLPKTQGEAGRDQGPIPGR